MSFFVTEKEVEELLQTETRDLPMPDGTLQPFTGFHIMWNSQDYLMENYDLALTWFVELALADCKELGYPFEKTFPNTVGYVRTRFQKRFE